MKEVAVFISASETHNQKNVNKSIDETLRAFDEVIEPAIEAGLRVRGYVSTLWGCPYEGEVDPRAGLRIADILLERGCYQISLGDTIGVGTPLQTKQILELFLASIPADKLALHLHDTRGTALANVIVGLEMGIRTYDASVGGLGGCPYAPGPRETSRPKISSIRSRGWASAPGSTLKSYGGRDRSPKPLWGESFQGKCIGPGCVRFRAERHRLTRAHYRHRRFFHKHQRGREDSEMARQSICA